MTRGEKLRPRAARPAETVADETQKNVEDSSRIGAEGHGAAQCDLTSERSRGRKKRFLPCLGDFDGEVPCGWRARFVAAELAGDLIHRAIEGAPVSGIRADVQPDFLRT